MDAHRRSQIAHTKSQYKSMAYNAIAHGVTEVLNGGETWETCSNSTDCAYSILENVFSISNARDTIPIVIAHRLPSTKPGHKPLIFKLASMEHKDILWNHIKNVKKYNESVAPNRKVSIQMVQLPEKLAHDKQSLQADFDVARTDNLSPKWRYLKNSGVYCYIIGSDYFKPKLDYYIHKYVADKKVD